jgi:hypothetical protein
MIADLGLMILKLAPEGAYFDCNQQSSISNHQCPLPPVDKAATRFDTDSNEFGP